MDIINQILIALVSGLAVLLYKAQRDLVKNDLFHFKEDISDMVASIQANVRTLTNKVGWLSYDMNRVKRKLDIMDEED